jgi:hypothetical protein
MKRRGLCFLVGAFLAALASPAFAEPPPHLDMVRALRERNDSDLALMYLDVLAKDPSANISPQLLALERARTQLEMAANEFNVGKRDKLFTDARAGFTKFIKEKATDPLAAEAAYDAARILSLEGRGIVTRSRVRNHGSVQEGDALKALEKFTKALPELADSIEKINNAIANGQPTPVVMKSLEHARLAATLEFNITRLDRAAAIEDSNGGRDEAATLRAAATTALIDKDKALLAKDPTSPNYWIAKAWLFKAYSDQTLGDKAKAELDAVLAAPAEAGESGKRLVRFLRFMDYATNNRGIADTVKFGDEWLKLYRSFSRTPQGYAVQYQMGMIYFNLAKNNLPDPEKGGKVDPKTKENIEKALTYLKPLAETENDYTELADGAVNIMTLALNDAYNGKIEEITTFERAYNLYKTMASKLGKQKEDEQKRSLGEILKILQHGLALPDAVTQPAKYAEARSDLAYVYIALDQPLQAAVAGEDVAYRMAASPKAAAGAEFAIQAYLQLLEQSRGASPDNKFVVSVQERLKAIFEHLEKRWPNENATDAARHRLGISYIAQENYKDAADVLARVTAGYKPAGMLVDAKFQLARSLGKLASDPKVQDADKKVFQARQVKALQDVPEVEDSATPYFAQIYVQSKLMLGFTLYETKDYKQLDDVSNLLKRRLDKFKLDAATKADLQKTVDALGLWAKFGRATEDLEKGKIDEATKETDATILKVQEDLGKLKKMKELTDYYEGQKKIVELDQKDPRTDAENAILAKLKADFEGLKEKGEPIERQVNTYVALLRGLMIVSLRANVQKGNLAGARKVLHLLQDLDTGGANVGANIYRQLIIQFNKQIKDLEADPKTKPDAEKLKKNFSDFLEELGKQSDLTVGLRFFLAHANESLGRYAQAAALLSPVPEPPRPAKGKPPADPKLEGEYRAARILEIHELTLAKDYAKAEELIKKIESTSDEWGKDSIEVLKTKAFVYQTQEKWAQATKAWTGPVDKLKNKMLRTQDSKDKEAYFEAFYEYNYCRIHYAITLKDPAKKPDAIKGAVKMIVSLENSKEGFGNESLKKKYQDLIAIPEIKPEYDEQKKAAAAAAATTTK